MSIQISRRRRIVAATVVALAFGASATDHASARPAGAGASLAAPPILPVPPAAERRAMRRAEMQEARRLAYTLPAGARYSGAEMDVFTTEGSSRLELPLWHWPNA